MNGCLERTRRLEVALHCSCNGHMRIIVTLLSVFLIAACSKRPSPATECVVGSGNARAVVRFEAQNVHAGSVKSMIQGQSLPVDIEVLTASDGSTLYEGNWKGPGNLITQRWRIERNPENRLVLFRKASDDHLDTVVELGPDGDLDQLVDLAADHIAEDANAAGASILVHPGPHSNR